MCVCVLRCRGHSFVYHKIRGIEYVEGARIPKGTREEERLCLVLQDDENLVSGSGRTCSASSQAEPCLTYGFRDVRL